jgi:hypothetical protein
MSKTLLRTYNVGRPGIFVVALCGVLPTACMHAAPPMLTERTAVISGHLSSGRTANDATEIVLFKAAAMTLDHGFRYFQVIGSDSVFADRGGNELIRPGSNVTIRVYRPGDIDPRSTGIIDAEYIAQNDRKELSRMEENTLAAPASPPPSVPSTSEPPATTQPPAKPTPTPHCTVYGCVW